MSEERWGTVYQACTHWNVSRRTIYNWKDNGRLTYKRTPGGSLRILLDDGGVQAAPHPHPKQVIETPMPTMALLTKQPVRVLPVSGPNICAGCGQHIDQHLLVNYADPGPVDDDSTGEQGLVCPTALFKEAT